MDGDLFEPVLIGITRSGQWKYHPSGDMIVSQDDGSLMIREDSWHVAMVPQSSGRLYNLTNEEELPAVDIVFPVIHGPMAEDGTLQGILKLANVPFVGADVLGSAVGMDKDVMKRLLRYSGLQIGNYAALESYEPVPAFEDVEEALGIPCFIKPANLGSSVGVSKVYDEESYQKALKEAFSYDHKIVIEENIEGREIECAVLGNENPKASTVGEISFSHDFYSYEAKYEDDRGYKIDIPAQVRDEQKERIREVSLKVFKTLSCQGFGRVDVFLTPDDQIIVNEINTIPGFTQISMYPQTLGSFGIVIH